VSEYLWSADLHASQALTSQASRVLDVTSGAGLAVRREMRLVGMSPKSESAAREILFSHAPAITTP
jgi:hypothetical protein